MAYHALFPAYLLWYNPVMPDMKWPDVLNLPTSVRMQYLLEEFWRNLSRLPDLVNREEYIGAERHTAALRDLIIEMMLALNGIAWPGDTAHLNGYLGESQRLALEKTLITPAVSGDGWVGRAVALVVIYRWYAPQLVEKHGLTYPQLLEADVWQQLRRTLPEWPLSITTN